MDRPILLVNLQHAPNPELGVKVLSAPDPDTLTRRCQALINAAAAGGSASPFVQGFELAGGGSGASCQAILTLTRNLGWGLNTSIPAALARVKFRKARAPEQITRVLELMYAEIAAEASLAPFIWQPRIVGTGRDGTYLIGLLWADGSIGNMCLNVEAFAVAGPYTAATTILTLNVPATPDGTVDTDQSWHVTWGAIVNDADATGVKLRLERNSVSLWEHEEILAATDWESCFGQYNHLQSAAGASTYDLIVEPTVGGNAVNVRGVSLRAEICNYQNNPS